MKRFTKRTIAFLSLVALLLTMVSFPPAAEAIAAYEFYGDYTDVAKIYDYNSCPSIQGLAVGSQYLYTIKINSTDDGAFISMTDKDTGNTQKLYNGDSGSYMFTNLDHSNDMDVWGIDGYSHLFVATTKKGASGIVRFRREGSKLYQVAEYHLKCDGADICSTAMSIMSVSNGEVKLLTKWGMDLYTGTISATATNETVNMTKLCTIVKSQAYIKDTYNDLSNYVNQGMGYHNGMLYLPISGDDSNLNRSVILVYNLENASGLVYPIEHLSFRVTSSAYSALFELESCDICSADGKLYFAVQRRVTNSDTNHDGVASFDGYTFAKVTSQTTHYTVKYDANGGTGSMADTHVSYGYKVPLRANTFTRSGYSFAGWAAHRQAKDQWYYTDGTNTGWYAEGSQPAGYTYSIYEDGVTVAKSTSTDNDVVTMYAQWTPLDKTYTIKYFPNGGTGTMADTEVVYGYSTPLRKNTFTRSGYTFLGWTAHRQSQDQWYYTDGTNSGWYAEGSQPSGYTKSVYKDEVNVAKTTAVDGDVVYMYAQWEQNCTDHGYTSQVTTAPTCTTAGVRTYTCSNCGDSYTEAIASTGHSYSSKVTPPTCTATGYTTYTCSGCGDTYTGDTTAAVGHSYTATVTPPTCTDEGFTTYTCDVCGDSYNSDTTATVGHSYTSKVTTAATCTTAGVRTYTCGGCGDSYTESIASTGHTYSSSVTAPTCTEAGYTTYTCADCGNSYTSNTTAAIGHSWSGGTCSNCGESCSHTYSNNVCTICGTKKAVKDLYLFGWINGADYACEADWENLGEYKFVDGKVTAFFTQDSYVAVKSGDNQDWYMLSAYYGESVTAGTLFNTSTGAAEKLFVPGGKDITFTLMDNGDDTYTLSYVATACTHPGHDTDGNCTKCGAAVGHSYSSTVTAPTCTVDGYTTYTCSACGHSYTGSTVAATGHSYGSWVETVAPTCTEKGELKRTCASCGFYQVQAQAATGHSYSAVVTAPTCTAEGYTTYTCSCGDSYIDDVVAATGHSYTDGACTVCGEADPDYSTVTQPTLTLKYPSLSFEAEILYNVYYIAENTDDVVEMGLLTFDSEVADGSIDNATDVIPGFETDGTMWKVGTNGISAKNLGDDLYFMVYAELTDGSYVYSAMKSYSAVSYASTILKRTTSSDYMKALVVSMLNYGTEAQLYFGHNTDSLMNASLTAEQQALVGAYDESMMDSVVAVDSTKAKNFIYDGSSFTRRAPSVSFDGAFSINYYFTAANAPDDGMTLYYWNIADYVAADVLTVDNATGSMEMVATDAENQYWGNVAGIAAKELDKTVFVVGVYEYEGTTYTTGILNYSIGKYCEGIAANSASNQQAFAQATAVYGYCAKEYFANL